MELPDVRGLASPRLSMAAILYLLERIFPPEKAGHEGNFP